MRRTGAVGRGRLRGRLCEGPGCIESSQPSLLSIVTGQAREREPGSSRAGRRRGSPSSPDITCASMDGNVHAQAHTALPHALPQVTKVRSPPNLRLGSD